MGSVLTIVCCSGSIGENNVEEEVEDKFTVGENVQNNDDAPQMRMPALVQQQAAFPRSLSETTTIPAR
jgi:hypothetical protein